MSAEERQKHLQELQQAFEKPGGAQALRFVLNALGSIPVVGGALAGGGTLWGEREQTSSNRIFLEWAGLAELELSQLSEQVQSLLSQPSKASMFLLLGEILGEEHSAALMNDVAASVKVVLHPSTVAELEPYISREWLEIRPTSAVCSMGAENRVSNHVEELKRPHGLGSGYVVSITAVGFELP